MILPDFLVQDSDGYIHLAGHRIGLQDVVYYYNEGCSAEELCEVFPTLPLALVHKVIAFYLESRWTSVLRGFFGFAERLGWCRSPGDWPTSISSSSRARQARTESSPRPP